MKKEIIEKIVRFLSSDKLHTVVTHGKVVKMTDKELAEYNTSDTEWLDFCESTLKESEQ